MAYLETVNQGNPGTPNMSWFVDIQGHAGAAVDAAPGATAPANGLQVGGVDYSGNFEAFATDTTGKQRIIGASSSPAIIQKANGVVAAGTSIAVAFTNPVKLGNTIVVLWGIGSSGAIAAGLSDTFGNIFQTVTANAAQSMTGAVASAPITVGGSDTVTLAWTGSLAGAMEIYEVEGAGVVEQAGNLTGNSAGTTAVTLAFTVSQPNEIGFFFVCAGAGTISATSPASPSNISSDSGNLATGGATLVNFAAFSSLLGGTIESALSQQTNNSTAFKATIGSSVAVFYGIAVFRPAALQVTGLVGDLTATPVLADAVSNAPNTRVTSAITGTGNTSAPCVTPTFGFLFNGTTWDRQRGNVDGSLGDTQTIATATTTNGAKQTNYNAKGAIITVVCGTVSGTLPTLQLQLEYSYDGGTTWITLGGLTTTFALATGNSIVLLVYPIASLSTTTGATQTNDFAFPMPRTWRLQYVTTGTGISIPLATTAVQYLN